MAKLGPMPPLVVSHEELVEFGRTWNENGGSLSRTPPHSSAELGRVFELAVARSLATMLGNLEIVTPKRTALTPPLPQCVEIGDVRIVGDIRAQNFDVVYRPDGVRIAFDSKTLNDEKSIAKNWQNMINDLSTEAATVHARFPFALAAFLVACPAPCVPPARQRSLIGTLERLARRTDVHGPAHMAEVIALVVWNPDDGTISSDVPDPTSPLRIEEFSRQVEEVYSLRYQGLPPHTQGNV